MAKFIALSKQSNQPNPTVKPPPGFTGTMPLPVGQILRSFKPTEGEREVLEKVGWKDGDPVPENLADIIEEAKKAQQSAVKNLQPPVPMNTPPLQLPPEQPFSALPEEHQADIYRALQAAKQAPREDHGFAYGPGVAEAIQAATKPVPAVVDDRTETVYAGTNVPKRQTSSIDTGADEHRFCVQCGFDQTQPSLPVDDVDKFVFVQSVLGGVPFQKVYKVLGGSLFVTLRSITPKEKDVIFKQTQKEAENNELLSPMERTEQILRYMLCLRIIKIEGRNLSHDLPDSLEGWITSFKEAGYDTDSQPPLKLIADYLYENIIKTESMHRLLAGLSAEFARLLVKLEVNFQNPDFWKGITGSP